MTCAGSLYLHYVSDALDRVNNPPPTLSNALTTGPGVSVETRATSGLAGTHLMQSCLISSGFWVLTIFHSVASPLVRSTEGLVIDVYIPRLRMEPVRVGKEQGKNVRRR